MGWARLCQTSVEWKGSPRLTEQSFGRGELARIPVSAQGLDELDAGSDPLHPQIHQQLAVAEQSRLGGDDVEKTVNTQLVTIHGEIQETFRGFDRSLLFLDLLCEYSRRGEIVLDLLKRRQSRLPEIGNGPVISGAKLLNGRLALPGVEQRLGGAGAD